MELTLTMRLRIAASVGIGVVLIGLVGWQLAAPEDPLGVLSILEGSLNLSGAAGLVFLAFAQPVDKFSGAGKWTHIIDN